MLTRSQTKLNHAIPSSQTKLSLVVPIDNTHSMITRSKAEPSTPRETVSDIDFDGASKAWRSNKIHVGNGHFEYIGMRTRSSKTRT
jgi:hypothetical protein